MSKNPSSFASTTSLRMRWSHPDLFASNYQTMLPLRSQHFTQLLAKRMHRPISLRLPVRWRASHRTRPTRQLSNFCVGLLPANASHTHTHRQHRVALINSFAFVGFFCFVGSVGTHYARRYARLPGLRWILLMFAHTCDFHHNICIYDHTLHNMRKLNDKSFDNNN